MADGGGPPPGEGGEQGESEWDSGEVTPTGGNNEVSISRSTSLSSHMEALKVSVSIQKDVIALVEANYLRYLRLRVESVTPETPEQRPTLAEQARYVKLKALTKVLEEVIPIELQLLDWVSGLSESTPANVLNDIQKTLQGLEQATNSIPDDWEVTHSLHGNNDAVSTDDVTLNLSNTSSMSLERRISLLHNSIEGVLEALSRLLVNVMQSDVNITSTSPCDVTTSDLSLLYLKMPQPYICVNQS